MKQAHIYVSGFVQGVGFRNFVRSKARKLGVKGWVRNLSDGRVEAVFQAEEELIHGLMKHTKRGSFFARVHNIAFEWEEITEQFVEFLKKETKQV